MPADLVPRGRDSSQQRLIPRHSLASDKKRRACPMASQHLEQLRRRVRWAVVEREREEWARAPAYLADGGRRTLSVVGTETRGECARGERARTLQNQRPSAEQATTVLSACPQRDTQRVYAPHAPPERDLQRPRAATPNHPDHRCLQAPASEHIADQLPDLRPIPVCGYYIRCPDQSHLAGGSFPRLWVLAGTQVFAKGAVAGEGIRQNPAAQGVACKGGG